MRLTVVVLLLAICLARPVSAAEHPRLEVEFEETETLTGQPLNLRLTILVPTYMPRAPAWPSFEAPNLLVRVPPEATMPTSRRIDGTTWSGVTRRYSVTPLVPGRFAIPSGQVSVTYADGSTNAPTSVRLATPELFLTGTVPAGAEQLDPFFAARELRLTEEIEGHPAQMVPGDSVIWTVTARVRGALPMLLPALIPELEIPGVAAYRDEPVLEQREVDGLIEGSRTERVTLVAEGGGEGQTGAVEIDWYDIDAGRLDSATLAGLQITVDGPPAGRTAGPDWRRIALVAAATLIGVLLLIWLARRLAPGIGGRLRDMRDVWQGSELHAYRLLRRAVSRRDIVSVEQALDEWSATTGTAPRADPLVQEALTALGAARYGRRPQERVDSAWQALAAALAAARRRIRCRRSAGDGLPPLNPLHGDLQTGRRT